MTEIVLAITLFLISVMFQAFLSIAAELNHRVLMEKLSNIEESMKQMKSE